MAKTAVRTVYVPKDSFVADVDGVPETFKEDETRVSEEWLERHPELRGLFQPIPVHFDVEQATASPGEHR